jgi:hypothetical protein
MIASLVGLTSVGNHASVPDPEDQPGSGVVIRTEVAAVWVPQALCNLARLEAGHRMHFAPEEVQTYFEDHGWKTAWYALTYRGLQVNGQSGELTQIRFLSEAADHLAELQAVMATAAGRPPYFEDVDFSHSSVEIIPDALQAVDPREAFTSATRSTESYATHPRSSLRASPARRTTRSPDPSRAGRGAA